MLADLTAQELLQWEEIDATFGLPFDRYDLPFGINTSTIWNSQQADKAGLKPATAFMPYYSAEAEFDSVPTAQEMYNACHIDWIRAVSKLQQPEPK